jgi:hypothetical protein
MSSVANGITVLFENLERNNYFYGKMLDVGNLKLEQSYFVRKRWLLNRLVTGAGVACGLNVTADPAAAGQFFLSPGLAIDACGREIIVAETTSIDATQLTDDKGTVTGPVPAGKTVEISIAYSEVKRSPVPVLVADCDHPGNCTPDLIREDFKILVREAGDAPAPRACPIPGAVFTPGGLNAALEPWIAADCAPVPALAAVAVARYTASTDTLDLLSRPMVFGNELLYGLICCLADRVAQLAGAVQLLYLSGDGQSAKTGTDLAQPVRVHAVDQTGNPVTGLTVQFSVTAGGGSAAAVTETPGGIYETTWTMGPPGPQGLTAKTAGSTLTVQFEAVSLP